MTEQPAPAAAERQTHGDLFLPRADPSEHEISEVCAGYQEHKPNRTEQDVERQANVTDDNIRQTFKLYSMPGVLFLVLL